MHRSFGIILVGAGRDCRIFSIIACAHRNRTEEIRKSEPAITGSEDRLRYSCSFLRSSCYPRSNNIVNKIEQWRREWELHPRSAFAEGEGLPHHPQDMGSFTYLILGMGFEPTNPRGAPRVLFLAANSPSLLLPKHREKHLERGERPDCSIPANEI